MGPEPLVREYAFTNDRIIVRGKLVARGKQKRADYLLFYESNLPIAVIEAKGNNHSLGAGVGLKTVEELSRVVF